MYRPSPAASCAQKRGRSGPETGVMVRRHSVKGAQLIARSLRGCLSEPLENAPPEAPVGLDRNNVLVIRRLQIVRRRAKRIIITPRFPIQPIAGIRLMIPWLILWVSVTSILRLVLVSVSVTKCSKYKTDRKAWGKQGTETVWSLVSWCFATALSPHRCWMESCWRKFELIQIRD